MNILEKIVADKRMELQETMRKKSLSSLKALVEENSSPFDFFESLKKSSPFAIIAECKKMSPSKGVIEENYDPLSRALSYERGGAAAVSVLTDEKYFGGRAEHLREVCDHVNIPVLRKDFIVDEYQIWEARYLGASSFLLIAGVLDTAQLQYFIEIGRDLGMEALVESYSEEDLELALGTDAKVLGVNNRNLTNMEVDFSHILNLKERIESSRDECVLVCESGVASLSDIELMGSKGIKAFLIGEFLMRQGDPEATLKQILR